MSVPVLIPARDEAEFIGRTLEALPAEADPFVIANGCTDDTAAIAEEHGATVWESPIEGKLPAIQHGIERLGAQAVEPFVLLDADSRPRFPDRWLEAMFQARRELDPDRPALVTGSFRYEGHDRFTNTVRNTSLRIEHWRNRHNLRIALSGANLLFDLHDEAVVQPIMELPNIWPFADQAIRNIIVAAGGQLANNIKHNALVMTDDSDRHENLLKQIIRGTTVTDEQIAESYLAEAPPDSITYVEYLTQIEKAERNRRAHLVSERLGLL